MTNRLKAAIAGATGIAGQQFIRALADHPLFEVTALLASQRSAGKSFVNALRTADGFLQWFNDQSLTPALAALVVLDAAAFDPTSVDIVFSALEADAAKEFEPRCAQFVPVLSTASAFRMESDVPILVPAVNGDHMPLIRTMQRKRGWKGFVAPGANCTAIGLAITLAPLQKAFGIRSVLMTSLQAVSGAGRSPGVIGLDIIDNVIPHIANEEMKVQREIRKILGRLGREAIEPATFPVGATCTRVPVLEGHTECVSVSLEQPATVEEVSEALRSFGREFRQFAFPSTPQQIICVHTDPYRPQPRLDRDAEKGMTTHVGRIRECPALPNGISYVLVSHNTRMGAAGGSILTAEELQARGYFTTPTA